MDPQIWESHRQKAMYYRNLCAQSFKNSEKAYKQGDIKKAKMYSDERKKNKRLHNLENELAANAIFIVQNKSRPFTEIDLHGLFVKEAIKKLEDRIIYAKDNGILKLDVIVGQGHHSENEPKIKLKVIDFANNDERISSSLDIHNPGLIHFHLQQSVAVSSMADDREDDDSSIAHDTFEKSGFQIVKKKKKNQRYNFNNQTAAVSAFVANIKNQPSDTLSSTLTEQVTHEASVHMDSTEDLECNQLEQTDDENISRKSKNQKAVKSNTTKQQCENISRKNKNRKAVKSNTTKQCPKRTRNAYFGTIQSKSFGKRVTRKFSLHPLTIEACRAIPDFFHSIWDSFIYLLKNSWE